MALLTLFAMAHMAVAWGDDAAFNNHCRTCHSMQAGDNRLGPSLHNIYGAKAAAVADYQSYSQALASSGITWDEATLDRFIERPEQVILNNNMKPYPGINDAAVRQRIISFLKSSSMLATLPAALMPAADVTSAQVAVSDVTREIDTQVWIPMLRASDQFDAEGFLAVQSAELIRISVDRNEIYGLDRYAGEIRAGFARARERKLRRSSTVRFLTRTHSGGLARDTGIFRSEVVLASGEARVSYTAFEMVLRKEDGRWKLLLDQDAYRGGTITEQDYLKGAPLASRDVVPAANKQIEQGKVKPVADVVKRLRGKKVSD